jgi:hypothetical protein
MIKFKFQQEKLSLYGKSHYSGDDFLALVYFMILRMLCFSMDKINLENSDIKKYLKLNSKFYKQKYIDTDYNFSNYLFYTLYPSFIYISPFVPFKNFILTVNNLLLLFIYFFLVLNIIIFIRKNQTIEKLT